MICQLLQRRPVIGALTGLLSLVSSIAGQTVDPADSPRQVLEAYLKMDSEGGRLSARGWEQAAQFFVKPGPAPASYVVAVTYGDRITDPTHFKGKNRARIEVICSAQGQIDSSGVFTNL